MSDEFWTPEEAAEFAEAERDDEVAAQAAEDQFPDGWTNVGATTEGVELGGGVHLGPAQIFTKPVLSPVFEAIDRASEDRTPLIDITPARESSWARMARSFTEAALSFESPAPEGQNHAAWKREMLEQIYGPLPERPVRRVALMGTGYRRHQHPGPLCPYGGHRAEHARARRLYSERLRRDRRRVRKGRTPILRSSAFQALIPRAQVNPWKTGDELLGMEVIASPIVPDDQVYVVDPSVMDAFSEYQFVEPKNFMQDPERPRSRFADQVSMYGYGLSLTGRLHRATNYIIQADNAEREAAGIRGYRPSRVWVDDVEVDVDTWMNEGGA